MSRKRQFVIDTNVLMHDPTAIFRFAEHDLFLPMVVLEELDANKKGLSEPARNARQVSRFLDQLVGGRGHAEIEAGLELNGLAAVANNRPAGRLYIQTHELAPKTPIPNQVLTADNTILSVTLALSEEGEHDVVLVSKDINLRIKAAVLGLKAEDYYNDKVLDDADLLYKGWERLSPDAFNGDQSEVKSWHEEGKTYYRLPITSGVWPNQFLFNEEDGLDLWVRDIGADSLIAELAWDYRRERHAVWGITARNREQSYALNLLMDSDIDFVTLLGPAGTGKTLLALAAGLAQTLDDKRYREIVMTRVTVPLGEDIGFLPGTEEEKMTPWMGALMDNLEVLTEPPDEGGLWARGATENLLASRIKIRSLNFMRGRTFLNRYIIIDEAQNLTAKQIKALVTRAGPGTKMVVLGNIAQIDTPYLTENTSGLTYLVDRFKGWKHSGHITLQRVERSRLADYASETL